VEKEAEGRNPASRPDLNHLSDPELAEVEAPGSKKELVLDNPSEDATKPSHYAPV